MSLRTFGLFCTLLSTMLSGTTVLASEGIESKSARTHHCLSANFSVPSIQSEIYRVAYSGYSLLEQGQNISGQLAVNSSRKATHIKAKTANRCGQCHVGDFLGFPVGNFCLPCGFSAPKSQSLYP